jgi:pyridoxamine 5'-phosphate oxidase
MDNPLLNQSLHAIRREYGSHALDHEHYLDAPMLKAQHWLEEAIQHEEMDPNAMVLSTVDAKGFPDARVVLLKEISDQGFVFFTHYDSAKGYQLEQHPYAALTFFWPKLIRQLRVRGSVHKINHQESERYFQSRPRLSQVGAVISAQSQPIASRDQLVQAFNQFQEIHAHQTIDCPATWGGYRVQPLELEFWQGCDNRLHDRLHYSWTGQQWQTQLLAP